MFFCFGASASLLLFGCDRPHTFSVTAMSLANDRGDLLAVIVSMVSTQLYFHIHAHVQHNQLDLNPIAWEESARDDDHGHGISLSKAMEALLVFCNAHLALSHENHICVAAASLTQRCVMALYIHISICSRLRAY